MQCMSLLLRAGLKNLVSLLNIRKIDRWSIQFQSLTTLRLSNFGLADSLDSIVKAHHSLPGYVLQCEKTWMLRNALVIQFHSLYISILTLCFFVGGKISKTQTSSSVIPAIHKMV